MRIFDFNSKSLLCVIVLLNIHAMGFQIDVTVGVNYYTYANTFLRFNYIPLNVSSPEECFRACQMDSACLFITFRLGRDSECFLSNGDDQRPNKNVNYITISKQALPAVSPYYYKYWSVRLLNYYKWAKKVNTENDCYELCSNEPKCHAITYDTENKICYFCEKDKYESVDDLKFISMSVRQKLNLKHVKPDENPSSFVYENLRLYGDYKNRVFKPIDSPGECFDECKNDTENCFAILYGPHNKCYFYKKGEFSIITVDQKWIVISRERLVEEPNIYRFVGVRLHNHYDYISASNEQCRQKCQSDDECFAMAYRPNSNMGCLFYKNDQYRTSKVDVTGEKWEIISKDVIMVDEKKFEKTEFPIDSEHKNKDAYSRPFNYPDTCLTNHYSVHDNIKSAERCFENCKLDIECFAVGFHKQRILCNFYKAGQFEMEYNNEWLVLSKHILELGVKTTSDD